MRTEIAEEVQKYKDFIEEELTQTISMDKLVSLFKEMSGAARREMAVDLHLPSVRTSKSMPTILFIKEIRKYVKSRQDHFNRKYTLITSLIKQLMIVLEEEDENTLESFLARREAIIAEHGFWHYYWSLYFHPGRTEQEALWKQSMEELEGEGGSSEGSSNTVLHLTDESSLPAEAEPSMESTEPSLELEQRIIELKKKLNHETHLRKQAELSLGKTEKQIHRLNRQLTDIDAQLQLVQQESGQVQQDKDLHIQELESILAQRNEELRVIRQERSKLQKESELMQQELAAREEQMQSVRSELLGHEEKLNQLRRQVNALRADNDELNRQVVQAKKSAAAATVEVLRPKSLTSSIQDIIQLLYTDVEDTVHAARNTVVQSGKDGRQKIRESLALIDELEQFIERRNEHPAERSGSIREHSELAQQEECEERSASVHARQRHDSMPYAESACALESSGTAVLERSEGSGYAEPFAPLEGGSYPDGLSVTDEGGLNGTFFRRDHGGYIVLETGQTFNITESLVLQHQLQHEAGVLCRPKQHDPTQYEIELLLQGDDSNSSIVQYDGYVHLGEHFTWYCVDLNDPQHRFPLHERDVAIRTPKDGDPCSFNVEIGKQVARLSRLYRAQPISELDAKRTASSGAAVQSVARAAKAQAKKEYEKPEPFLEGHQITIVGGLKKWFEEVVAETGATLVHENGKNPKRIFHDLKRSSALFLLLTATSHQAYWDCVEIAKQNQIPFYFIEGSKSNLRHLLWNNQDQIIAHAKAN
ncbi:hypothetical protein [Paenibacillus alvei]|uniref:hypothetical protein n=1 Tax=Paenibacillus alvei TaxID=44250 RepID=UPI0022824779|nr:hypothetical protein [Paenibacillus alvei]